MPADGARYRQSQIVAQRRVDIFPLKQTTALDLGHQQAHDVIIRARLLDAASKKPSQAGR
jgi:hypothetical protein